MSFIMKYLFKKRNIEIFTENQMLKFDKSEYDATYNLAKAAYRYVGMRLTRDDPPLAKMLWKAFYFFECMSLVLAMSLEVLSMKQTAIDGSFIDLFTMMPCVGYLIVCTIKAHKIFYYRPVHENLISELGEMWPKGALSKEEYDIVQLALVILRHSIKCYCVCNIALLFIFSEPPFISMIKRALGQDVPLVLGFSFWFPFDPYKPGRFQVIAVIQMWFCSVAVGFMMGTDILFCVYLSHITTQFDLLAVRIRKLFHVPLDDQLLEAYPLGKYSMDYSTPNMECSADNGTEKMYHKDLVEIVSRHRALVRLSGDVEDQFTFSLLINFINSSIIICFCGFCCVFVEKWTDITYKIFLTTASLQIWLLCWYGQKLLDSSQGIADAVYCSGWYDIPQHIKSSLIIILYRAQREVCITTYGFSIISISSYSTILRTSWSYLMLLINVFKQ